MTLLEIVVLISTITGLNPISLLQLITKEKANKDIGKQLLLLFDIMSTQKDPLVGYWTLGEWNYKKIGAEGMVSTGIKTSKGSLSIYYKYPNELRWRGIMYLEYQSLKASDNWISRLPKGLLKKLGLKYFGFYDVEFQKKGEQFHGTSSLKWRDPDNGKKYTGQFTGMQIKNGCYEGRFENYGKDKKNLQSIADPIIFIQKRRWAESLIEI